MERNEAKSGARWSLPANADELWEDVLSCLLGRWHTDEKRAALSVRFAEELAFHRLVCNRPLALPFVEMTQDWLQKETRLHQEYWLPDTIGNLERYHLLVRSFGSDGNPEFSVPVLSPFLAARFIVGRWADHDPRFLSWLPLTDGWWERGTELNCPNPHCGGTVPRFRDLLGRAECEEVVLLMVSLLKDKEWERAFVGGISLDEEQPQRFEFVLKTVSRCRYPHVALVQKVVDASRTRGPGVLWNAPGGLVALGSSRVHDNVRPVLEFLESELRGGVHAVAAAFALSWIGDFALDGLISALKSKGLDHAQRSGSEFEDLEAREAVAIAIGRIGAPKAVAILLDALLDDNWKVRDGAAEALVLVEDVPTEPLVALLRHNDDDISRAAAWVLGRLKKRDAVQALISVLGREAIFTTVAEALAQIGDERGAAALRAYVRDSTPWVQEAAQRSLEKLDRAPSTTEA